MSVDDRHDHRERDVDPRSIARRERRADRRVPVVVPVVPILDGGVGKGCRRLVIVCHMDMGHGMRNRDR